MTTLKTQADFNTYSLAQEKLYQYTKKSTRQAYTSFRVVLKGELKLVPMPASHSRLAALQAARSELARLHLPNDSIQLSKEEREALKNEDRKQKRKQKHADRLFTKRSQSRQGLKYKKKNK